jgi:hypothetical protein
MTTSDVRWSCTAQLDLLGFSNHLALTNWDIRTQTGVQAIERLTSLEGAIRLFEHERTDYPQLYPSGLQYIRFNDALFLGIDDQYLEPPPGRITLTGGYSWDQLRKIRPQNGQTALQGTAVEPGSDVAKFLGLVARIHTYVNRREAEKSFPGCRTVVASGLRKCFADRKGIDDFFSANFSVSTVFEAETKGNSVGLKDNHLYVEDDVGMAISYCQPCHAILGYSKFIRTDSSLIDPYQCPCVQKNMIAFPRVSYSVPELVVLDILKRRLTFRRLNPTVLTNLQLFKDYQRFGTENGQLEREISDSLSTSTPSLAEVNSSSLALWKQTGTKYPFLSLEFSLDTDYRNFFGQE